MKETKKRKFLYISMINSLLNDERNDIIYGKQDENKKLALLRGIEHIRDILLTT